jgi:hypothetical protein
VSGGVRGMKMRRAPDAEARHRVLTQFHASRLIQAGVSLLRPVRASTGWTCGRARPGHVICSVQCLPRRQVDSSRQARPAEARVPRATKPNWAGRCRRSPRWCSSPPCRRRGPEEPFPVPGRGEGPWRLTPLGRSPWSTMPSRTRAGLAAWRQVAHHPDECVQSPWGMRCRTMPDRRRTGFPPYRAAETS